MPHHCLVVLQVHPYYLDPNQYHAISIPISYTYLLLTMDVYSAMESANGVADVAVLLGIGGGGR